MTHENTAYSVWRFGSDFSKSRGHCFWWLVHHGLVIRKRVCRHQGADKAPGPHGRCIRPNFARSYADTNRVQHRLPAQGSPGRLCRRSVIRDTSFDIVLGIFCGVFPVLARLASARAFRRSQRCTGRRHAGQRLPNWQETCQPPLDVDADIYISHNPVDGV